VSDLQARSDGPRSGIARARGWRGFGLFGNIGISICVLYCLAAVCGPAVVPSATQLGGAAPFLRPSRAFPFGTDSLGRNELSRIVIGSQIAVLAAILAVAFAICLGTVMGVVAGYFGGLLDEVCSRVMDFIFGFPSYLLPILVVVALGPGLVNAALAIGLVFAPQFGRISRTATRELRHRAYVEVAILSKRRPLWIIVHHVLPNITGPIAVMTGLTLANAEGSYAVLSYLGFGVAPPTPDYGTMLADGQVFLISDPWLIIFPCAALVLLILGFLFLGDWLRSRFDPHGRVLFGQGSLRRT
jgi:peptide/nickel transport system permease protein